MGHASILASLGGRKILFDPVVLSRPYGDSWVMFPSQIVDERIFDVDAVLVSHIHKDHYDSEYLKQLDDRTNDSEYLKQLDDRTRILIIGGRPSFEADLKANGIKNLHIIEPEKVTEVFEGVFVFGVLHETNGIDASTIVFNDRFCFHHGNDNYLKLASFEKFKQLGRHINVACIPYAFIHWYPFLLEYEPGQQGDKEAESRRLIELYMNDCMNVSRSLKPDLVIPFGANLLLDDGNGFSDMNMAVKTPIEFCEYVQRQDPALSEVVQPLLAGDWYALTEGAPDLRIARRYRPDEYRAEATAFLAARPQRKVDPNSRAVDLHRFADELNSRLALIEGKVNETIRIELRHGGEVLRMQVDCRARQGRWVDQFSHEGDYHHFKLDPVASSEWLNGKRMEEIIGMRRFTIRRMPNVHKTEVLRVVNTVL